MEEPLLPLSTPFGGEEAIPAVTPAVDTSIASNATGSPSSQSSSTGNILTRLTSLVLLASISLWANHEASKGFQVTILNDDRGSDAGKRFDLLFVSNDRATKLVLDASSAIEQLLYPDSAAYPKKPVQHVALHLARHNLSRPVVAVSPDAGGFVIQVSPSNVMSGPAAAARMAAAIYRGMVRVWLWDREAPQVFLDAVEEHLSVSAGFPPAENHLPRNSPNGIGADSIGQFLRFCDGRTRDFIPRLNRVMRLRSVWSSGMEQLVLSSSYIQASPVESPRLCDSVLEPAGLSVADTTTGGVSSTVIGPLLSPPRCDGYSCSQ